MALVDRLPASNERARPGLSGKAADAGFQLRLLHPTDSRFNRGRGCVRWPKTIGNHRKVKDVELFGWMWPPSWRPTGLKLAEGQRRCFSGRGESGCRRSLKRPIVQGLKGVTFESGSGTVRLRSDYNHMQRARENRRVFRQFN